MSLEIQSKAANAFDFVEEGTKIRVYYGHPHQGLQGVTGDITSVYSDKLVIEPNTPKYPPILHVARCQEYWEEMITLCTQDWQRLGAVLMITINTQPIYYAHTDGV